MHSDYYQNLIKSQKVFIEFEFYITDSEKVKKRKRIFLKFSRDWEIETKKIIISSFRKKKGGYDAHISGLVRIIRG